MVRSASRGKDGIEGLPFNTLQGDIRWSGKVWLDMLKEADGCMLSMMKWPIKTGVEMYVCVTTGLLFDVEDGSCLQSSRVRLMLETIEPAKMSRKELAQWVKDRQSSEVKFGRYTLKEESDGSAEE